MSTYVTVQGDMWDSIAYTQLGSTAYTGNLMRANGQYLDYYIFPAGITLTLPNVDQSLEDSITPPWRQVAE